MKRVVAYIGSIFLFLSVLPTHTTTLFAAGHILPTPSLTLTPTSTPPDSPTSSPTPTPSSMPSTTPSVTPSITPTPTQSGPMTTPSVSPAPSPTQDPTDSSPKQDTAPHSTTPVVLPVIVQPTPTPTQTPIVTPTPQPIVATLAKKISFLFPKQHSPTDPANIYASTTFSFSQTLFLLALGGSCLLLGIGILQKKQFSLPALPFRHVGLSLRSFLF